VLINLSFENNVALVTGAGSGMGLATALIGPMNATCVVPPVVRT
jgi:hypothetical protein